MKLLSNGSRNNTKLVQNDCEVPFKTIAIWVDNKLSNVLVDGVPVDTELIIIGGVYTFVSNGTFAGSKLLIEDVPLRCIESVFIWLGESDDVLQAELKLILAPNLVSV